MRLAPLAGRMLRKPVLTAVLLTVVLLHFTVVGTASYRLAGAWFLFAVVTGFGLCAASALLVVARIVLRPPPPAVAPFAPHVENFTFLIALNLIILSPLAPAFQLAAMTTRGNPIARSALAAAGDLSADTLFWIFTAAIVVVAWMLVLRVLQLTVLRLAAARRLAQALGRGLVGVMLLYAAGAFLLIYNGMCDTSVPVLRRARLVQVSPAPKPLGFAWADIAWADMPGHLTSVVLVPDRDEVWTNQAVAGTPLRIRFRAGLFGVPWIEHVMIDDEDQLRRTVRSIPTAAAARKRLVARLVEDRRWDEVRAQIAAHLTVYPEDRAYAAEIAAVLRRAGQPGQASALEQAAR
jgi:hypothetical protein